MFKNKWLLPCLGLLLSFQTALAVRYNEPGCSYDSANQNFPHLDVKNQILDSIAVQNSTQLSALLSEHKDIILKYPWFLKDVVNYAAQNQDSKSIKTIVDELADPGLFQIFTKEDKPLGIFLFGTMHILPYIGIPQHIAQQIEKIARAPDSIFFGEKENGYYDDNPLAKNLLYFDTDIQKTNDIADSDKAYYPEKSEQNPLTEIQEKMRNTFIEKLSKFYESWNKETIEKTFITNLMSNEGFHRYCQKHTKGNTKEELAQEILNKLTEVTHCRKGGFLI